MGSISEAVPALKAAGLIGTWKTNVAAGRSVLDAGAASLLAGNASLAGQPIPMDVALGATHPDDRDWLFERIRRARRTGGPFSAEFRVVTGSGAVRWVLNRGCLTQDSFGAMQGLGAYLDTTDSHGTPYLSAASLAGRSDDPLSMAADHGIEAHAALKRGDHADVLRLAELLLIGIGRALVKDRRA